MRWDEPEGKIGRTGGWGSETHSNDSLSLKREFIAQRGMENVKKNKKNVNVIGLIDGGRESMSEVQG